MSHKVDFRSIRLSVIDFCIGFEKVEDVLEGESEVFECLFHAFFVEFHRFGFYHGRGKDGKAKAISTSFFDEPLRVGVVFQTFRHFFPIFGEDDSVYDDVFHCVFAFDSVSEDMEGSESSSGLV